MYIIDKLHQGEKTMYGAMETRFNKQDKNISDGFNRQDARFEDFKKDIDKQNERFDRLEKLMTTIINNDNKQSQ